jgi:hypothetical protein
MRWEIVVMGTLVVLAEVGLIYTMRQATNEIRLFRKEMPKMLGAFGGLSLLLEAYRTYAATSNDNGTNANPRGSGGKGKREPTKGSVSP